MLNLVPDFGQKYAYQTKQEFVYKTLRKAIMSCTLYPGEKLVISEIALQLDVSTIPVREALQLLQSENLIEYNAHSGANVSRITQSSIVETFAIKEGLEGVAARHAVNKLDQHHMQHLQKLVHEMDDVLKNNDIEKWTVFNGSFHKYIVNAASMPILSGMHLKTLDKWDRIHHYYFNNIKGQRHEKSQGEHYEIMNALMVKDGPKAEEILRRHNQNALRDYMKLLDDNDFSK